MLADSSPASDIKYLDTEVKLVRNTMNDLQKMLDMMRKTLPLSKRYVSTRSRVPNVQATFRKIEGVIILPVSLLNYKLQEIQTKCQPGSCTHEFCWGCGRLWATVLGPPMLHNNYCTVPWNWHLPAYTEETL